MSIVGDHITAITDSQHEFAKIDGVVRLLKDTIVRGNNIYICGNGGSAADAQHFAAELVGRFYKERSPYPCIALTTDSSILTAIGNDYGFEYIFSRQLDALAIKGDLLIAISTSGKSPNILQAIDAFSCVGPVIFLTGPRVPVIDADIYLQAQSTNTARIQEVHELMLHSICEGLDG